MPGSNLTPTVPSFLLPLGGKEIDTLWKFIAAVLKAAGFDASERLAVMDVLATVENDLLVARSDAAPFLKP